MRAGLLYPLRDRRHPRRPRSLRDYRRARSTHAKLGSGASDAAVTRVREAGGPLDEASYTCGCGYLFVASVSTTVLCPHCGAGQAW
jgi:hypothetical protein